MARSAAGKSRAHAALIFVALNRLIHFSELVTKFNLISLPFDLPLGAISDDLQKVRSRLGQIFLSMLSG